MIGHFLLQIGPVREDRILGTPMQQGMYQRSNGAGCLVGTAFGPEMSRSLSRYQQFPWCSWDKGDACIEVRYDRLCDRFGTHRVNAAIRNRILANRVWRALQGVAESVTV